MTGLIFFHNNDKHAPIKSMRASEKYCPWINKDQKGFIRERDKQKKAAVTHNYFPLMESYSKIRNKAIESILVLGDSTSRKKSPKLRATWKSLGGQSNKY